MRFSFILFILYHFHSVFCSNQTLNQTTDCKLWDPSSEPCQELNITFGRHHTQSLTEILHNGFDRFENLTLHVLNNVTIRWVDRWAHRKSLKKFSDSKVGHAIQSFGLGVIESLFSFVHATVHAAIDITSNPAWIFDFASSMVELGIHPEIIKDSLTQLLNVCKADVPKCVGFSGTQIVLLMIALPRLRLFPQGHNILEEAQEFEKGVEEALEHLPSTHQLVQA